MNWPAVYTDGESVIRSRMKARRSGLDRYRDDLMFNDDIQRYGATVLARC